MARLRAVVTSQARGLAGSSVTRPALRGDREGLLRGFLGEVEVAEEADQGSEDVSPLVAEGLLEDRYHSTIGPHLDGAAEARRRDPRGELDRGVEVVGLEQEVAADGFLDLDERAVGGERLAILHANGGRRLGESQPIPGVTPGVWLMAW